MKKPTKKIKDLPYTFPKLSKKRLNTRLGEEGKNQKRPQCMHDFRLYWKCIKCGTEEMHTSVVDAVAKDYVDVAQDDHKTLEDPRLSK